MAFKEAAIGLSLTQSVFDRPWFVARPIERQRHSTPTETRISTDSLSYPCDLVSAVHGRTCAKSSLSFLSARRSCGPFLDKQNCQLSVVAKLPFGVSRAVFLEGDGNFVEMTKAVNGSRGWRQLLVVDMPFEHKRVGIRPPDRRYKFVAHNCASDFGVALFAGRLVERQINFRKRFARTLVNRCLCPLWRRRWSAEKISGVSFV